MIDEGTVRAPIRFKQLRNHRAATPAKSRAQHASQRIPRAICARLVCLADTARRLRFFLFEQRPEMSRIVYSRRCVFLNRNVRDAKDILLAAEFKESRILRREIEENDRH